MAKIDAFATVDLLRTSFDSSSRAAALPNESEASAAALSRFLGDFRDDVLSAVGACALPSAEGGDAPGSSARGLLHSLAPLTQSVYPPNSRVALHPNLKHTNIPFPQNR